MIITGVHINIITMYIITIFIIPQNEYGVKYSCYYTKLRHHSVTCLSFTKIDKGL